ncbi:MAG TPA: DUF554 domain-containing protein [Deltaproteobacteria bacterium]|nr:DUF554 domain-containing protein [Deltaproteobacteria bacterium]HQI81714.1 DUF554 domain-containing protein [Deltaproteobacteria bacterium]
MIGTLANTSAIVAGSLVGVAAGRHLGEDLKRILMQALGLAVVVIGLQMALSAQGLIPSVACLLLGALTGELMRIERGVERIGEVLKARFASGSGTFVQGFVSATVLYITGAMTIIGCIQDGTAGNPDTLFLKSLLDGVASMALASTLGIGVAFSALSVLLVQGSMTLLAGHIAFLQEPAVLASITSTGGMIILAIGINLLGLSVIRVGNFIPALVYAGLYPLLFP